MYENLINLNVVLGMVSICPVAWEIKGLCGVGTRRLPEL